MPRRVMSIWLPRLPLDRLVRCGDLRTDGVFAVIADLKNAKRLTHISDAGIVAGLSVGMSLADARALAPDLLTEPTNPLREESLLRAIRRWADKLSPWLALDGEDGLILDISGCAHLYGGEDEMRKEALGQLADMQIRAFAAIADTRGAAWALARYEDYKFISPTGKTAGSIAELPIEALRVIPPIAISLRRVGLQTIGSLYRIKSSELARRYGLETSQRIAKILGHVPDPVSASASDPVFAARMNLPEPIGLLDDVERVLTRLTESVCNRLDKANLGARQFVLTVRCVDTGDHKIPIGFARPTHDQKYIARQFQRPLSELRMKFGADWFRLVAENLEPFVAVQRNIDGSEDVKEGLEQVITTLGNRIGFDRVRRFTPKESHIPERAFALVEAAHTPSLEHWPEPNSAACPRPIRTFRPERLRTLEAGRPPKKFQWRRESYIASTVRGPERLSPEWWQDRSEPVRDYWTVQTVEGPRLWLMTYPARTPPEWFVTGRFA